MEILSLRVNDRGLFFLNAEIMTAIFDCVYGVEGGLTSETRKLLKEQRFQDLIKLLLSFQEYNYRHRSDETVKLFPLFEMTVGPMNRNSDGTALWLAMGLAIKEVYGFRRETLRELLEKVNIRK